MSRSGYSEDCDNLALWRAAVARATNGKRGQAFLREMAAALDALPVRELIAGSLVRDNEHACALGAVALARGMDVSQLEVDADDDEQMDGEAVGAAFGIARVLALEIAFENDDNCRSSETPEDRWKRVRAWVNEQLRPTDTKGPTT